MNIFYNNSLLSFKKSLVANCAVLSPEKQPIPCKIYSFNPDEDLDYFKKIPNLIDWKKGSYYEYVSEDIDKIAYSDKYKIYSLENENGDCLACMEIYERDDKSAEILFLETVPSCSQRFNPDTPRVRYIGETIIAFLAKSLKKSGINRIEVLSSVNAERFYLDKCFFKMSKNDIDPFFLGKNAITRLIRQNEEHTGQSIELVG